MPSLKQQLVDDFKKQFLASEQSDSGGTDYYLNDNANEESLISFLSSSIDKIIETTKGCLPEESKEPKEGYADDGHGGVSKDYDDGFNDCRSKFLSNFKQRVEE